MRNIWKSLLEKINLFTYLMDLVILKILNYIPTITLPNFSLTNKENYKTTIDFIYHKIGNPFKAYHKMKDYQHVKGYCDILHDRSSYICKKCEYLVSTPSNIPPPGFNPMRRLSSESAASSENFSLSSGGGQSFDKKPPSFGGNDYENDNGGEDYDNDYDEHLNNIRSCDPEALDYDTNNSSYDGGNGMTPTKPPFRGGGGMRGRGNFTPDRGGFKQDHHRGGSEGFGNRGTPRGFGGFRGGGNFERGGGRGNGNWNGEQRGGGNWRPRRPWGGPSPGRGRGNW